MSIPPEVKRSATVKEVAKALGVSPSTISNAYNRPHHLSAELRTRVFETAQRLGYPGPNPIARSLRRGQAGALGVLYTERLSYAFGDPVASMFLQGLSAATENAGLGLLLVPRTPRDVPAVSTVQSAAVDGLVVYSVAEDDSRLTAALARRLPTIMVDQPRLEGLPFIGIDDHGAAREAAEHLVSLGHRAIGIVSFPLSPNAHDAVLTSSFPTSGGYPLSRARLRGYLEGLATGRLSFPADVSVYECAVNTVEHGRRAAQALFTLRPNLTAILAMSDQLALGVISAARAAERQVPQDLSVIGFDDAPAAEQASLTTIHQPLEEKGFQAGRTLIARLQGEAVPSVHLLQTHLVVRETTAHPGRRT